MTAAKMLERLRSGTVGDTTLTNDELGSSVADLSRLEKRGKKAETVSPTHFSQARDFADRLYALCALREFRSLAAV